MSWSKRLLWSLALAVGPNACVCDASECGSTETATFEISVDAAELAGARAVACRNHVCQAISLQPLAGGRVGASKFALDVLEPNPDPQVSFDPFVQTTTDGFRFTFVWGIDVTSDVKVGDQLSAQLSSSTGQELFTSAGTISKVSEDPPESCGSSCSYAEAAL